MLPPIHDSKLVGYEVDGREQRLSLTIEPASGARDAFRLSVEGYVAHFFPAPMLPAIIQGIYPVDAVQLVRDAWPLIEAGHADCGWPGPWAHSLETAAAFLAAGDYRGFRIESSYGLSGWVLGQSLTGRE